MKASKFVTLFFLSAFAAGSVLAGEGVVRKAVFAGGAGDKECAEVCAFSGKREPKVLVFCAAMRDAQRIIDRSVVPFQKVTPNVEAVKLFPKPPEELPALREKIQQADVIWFSGGMTEVLADRILFYHLGDAFRLAYRKGTVFAGHSAGAIILSHAGLTDYPNNRYDLVAGLGLINAYYCPHYQGGSWRTFDDRLKDESDVSLPDTAWAVEDGTMVFFSDEKPEVKKNNPKRNAYRFARKDGAWTREEAKPAK